MKDNLISSRTSYKIFEYDEPFKESIYNMQLSKPVKKNTLLILSKSYDKSLEKVKKIVKALKNKGFTVYVREFFKDDFKDVSYVKAVENNSEEYFFALAASQYIYTDTFLNIDFIKRKGQVLINDIKAKPTDIKKRINICSADNKSDYIIGKKNYDRIITFSSFLKRLANKNLLSKKKRTDKKKLLFFVNLKYFNPLYCVFENISQWLDYDKYDVTMVFSSNYLDEYGERINSLDSRINILAKRKTILCNEEENKRLAFLKNEYYYVDKPEKIKSFFSKALFKNEQKRIFGDIKYDYIINMKFDIFYYNWLIRSMKGKKIYFDINIYSKEKTPYLSGKAEYIGKNHKIVYLTKNSMDKAIKFDKKIFAKKAELMPYVPVKSKNSAYDAKEVEIDGLHYLMVKSKKMKGFDSLEVTTVPVFENNSIPYTVIDNTMTNEQALEFVTDISNKYNEIFVFDFYDILTDSSDFSKNIHYYNDKDIYISLLSRLGGFIVCGNDKGIIYEAKLYDKNIICLKQ